MRFSCTCWWPSRSSPVFSAGTSRSPRRDGRGDLGSITELLKVANRFDAIVKVMLIAVLVFGLLATMLGDLSLSDNAWLVVSVVPIVFLPRGRVFDAALADARERGEVTVELMRALRDPAVAFARNAELVVVALIIGLMVLRPF